MPGMSFPFIWPESRKFRYGKLRAFYPRCQLRLSLSAFFKVARPLATSWWTINHYRKSSFWRMKEMRHFLYTKQMTNILPMRAPAVPMVLGHETRCWGFELITPCSTFTNRWPIGKYWKYWRGQGEPKDLPKWNCYCAPAGTAALPLVLRSYCLCAPAAYALLLPLRSRCLCTPAAFASIPSTLPLPLRSTASALHCFCAPLLLLPLPLRSRFLSFKEPIVVSWSLRIWFDQLTTKRPNNFTVYCEIPSILSKLNFHSVWILRSWSIENIFGRTGKYINLNNSLAFMMTFNVL